MDSSKALKPQEEEEEGESEEYDPEKGNFDDLDTGGSEPMDAPSQYTIAPSSELSERVNCDPSEHLICVSWVIWFMRSLCIGCLPFDFLSGCARDGSQLESKIIANRSLVSFFGRLISILFRSAHIYGIHLPPFLPLLLVALVLQGCLV